ncbi:MAG: TIR domain-containing protein [Sphingomicrobium sp.]
MSDVFVSYKAEDRARIAPLVQALEAEGLGVWWDEQIAAGSEWREDIQRQLDGASCVLVAWSRRSIGRHGRFVREEASRAQRRGTYLPICIDRVDPPLGFGEIQALAMQSWNGDQADPRYQALLRAVRATMAGEPFQSPPPVNHRAVSRRTAFTGVAAIVAAGAVGAWQWLRPAPAGAARSIAVMPFANLSGDAAQNYFADGIAEELRSALSQLQGLKVAGRTSSEAMRAADSHLAARRLHVANILTGSVRRAPGMVRVAAQLVDGKDGLERWSETYDRPDGNVLAIQTDIAEKVVAALSIELGTSAIRALAAGGTRDSEAQDLYLRATEQARIDDSEDSLRQANHILDQALARDPKFARAYAAKSHNLSYLADVGHSPEETAQGYAAAVAAAQRALAIAPKLPGGYSSLADALYGQRKISAAISQIELGLAIAPNDIELLQAAVISFVASGDTRRALGFADRIIAVDPLNPLGHRRRSYALLYDRQYDACIAEARQTQKLAPTLSLPAYFIAVAQLMKGQPTLARQSIQTLPPDLTVRLVVEAIVGTRLGDRAASDFALKRLGAMYGDAASYQFAQAYAQRGERASAFAALQRGFAVNDPGLNTLAVDPLFDPIRRDPRFAAMLKRIDVSA